MNKAQVRTVQQVRRWARSCRDIVYYSALEADKVAGTIKGQPSENIEHLIGYTDAAELVRRDH